ncbi:hypothetical protein IFR05_016543 [Cadophora sp. M221]|nr:hypothetical protein IFR05_016543 [Cadophora sp. M221]
MPKVKWIVPFDRNSCFTGRELELTKLEKQLYAEGGPNKIAVIGLGGVGKTSLVVELAYRIRKHHKDCSIFWIPATTFESLQQAYLNICRQLRLPGWDNKNDDPKRLLQRYLSHEQPCGSLREPRQVASGQRATLRLQAQVALAEIN